MKTFKIGSIVRTPEGNEYKIVDFWADECTHTYSYVGEEVGRDVDVLDRIFNEEEIDNLELVSAPQKTYKLTETQLLELLTDSARLACLMEGGVDNWEWYGANTEEFIHKMGVDTSSGEDYGFDDVARIWINEYEEV